MGWWGSRDSYYGVQYETFMILRVFSYGGTGGAPRGRMPGTTMVYEMHSNRQQNITPMGIYLV